MKLSEFVIGQKLELNICEDGDNNLIALRTKIESVEILENEEFLVIHIPFYKGRLYTISSDKIIDIYFFCKGKLLCFKANVVEKLTKKTNDIPLYKIKKITNIDVGQRRAYFRLKYSLTVKYRLEEFKNSINEISYFTAFTSDISGNGMRMKIDDKLNIGEKIDCKIILLDRKVIEFKGRVVWKENCEFGNKCNYEVGIWFEDIDDRGRENIIKFIFSEQRKMLKRE